jgi:hypothetical protein
MQYPHISIESVDDNGNTFIILAAKAGSLEIV